jgi:hypothetical protein
MSAAQFCAIGWDAPAFALGAPHAHVELALDRNGRLQPGSHRLTLVVGHTPFGRTRRSSRSGSRLTRDPPAVGCGQLSAAE